MRFVLNITFVILMMICSILCFGQSTLHFELPSSSSSHLQLDAGGDRFYDGITEVVLGGEPTAWGQQGPVHYSWEPAEYLDNPSSPNPRITHLPSDTRFVLSARSEGAACAQQAELWVRLSNSQKETQPEGINCQAFPNPFTDQVELFANAEMRSLRIYSLSGQVVEEHSFGGAQNANISTSALTVGVYFFTIEFADGSNISKKLCKVH